MFQLARLQTLRMRFRRTELAAAAPRELTGRSAVRRWLDRLLIVLFVGAIGVPTVLGLAFSEPAVPPSENRNPEPFPGVPKPDHRWVRWPDQFEQFFNDRTGFRRQFLEYNGSVQLNWFELSSSPTVAIGSNGWLFYRQHSAFDAPVYRRPSQAEQASRWRRLLKDRQAWLEARGIRFLVVIAPEKESIYPEEYPHSERSLLDEPLLDEFLKQAEQIGLPVVDMRPALREAKSQEPLYLKYDTHWNGIGAWYGATAVLGWLKQWYPKMAEHKRDEYYRSSAPWGVGDLARNLGMPDCHENCPCLSRKHASMAVEIGVDYGPESSYMLRLNGARAYATDRDDRPNALFVHDSFGNSMRDHLSDEFHHLYCIASEKLPANFVEREKPDLVIQELVECKLKLSPERTLLPRRSE